MRFYLMLLFWKVICFVEFIQCEINTTIDAFFPSNHYLSEQAIYDLKNSMRLSKAMLDFDDDDDDYSEDEEIDNDNRVTVIIESTTSTIDTHPLKSSSSYFPLNLIYLFLGLLILTGNK